MTLAGGNPFGNFISVSDEMHRLFHGVFGQDGAKRTGVTTTREPPVDIYETDDALVLEVELPGVSKDTVSVELYEHTFTLSGERKRAPSIKGGQYPSGRGPLWCLPAHLPNAHDRGSGKGPGTYKNGVLALRLPKRDAARPQGIPITG